MSISIYFRTLFFGRLVGQDAQGNKYYEDRRKTRYGKPRRWVIYKKFAEASKIPPQWHGWLRYTMDQALDKSQQNFWEKDHLPNLTGTPYAHKPKGLKGLIVRKVYEPWTPPKQ